MQNQLDRIEEEVIKRIFKLALEKFGGNNSLFAKRSSCSESSIRRIYNGKQRMTFNMLLKLCNGLEVDIKDLLSSINTKYLEK